MISVSIVYCSFLFLLQMMMLLFLRSKKGFLTGQLTLLRYQSRWFFHEKNLILKRDRRSRRDVSHWPSHLCEVLKPMVLPQGHSFSQRKSDTVKGSSHWQDDFWIY